MVSMGTGMQFSHQYFQLPRKLYISLNPGIGVLNWLHWPCILLSPCIAWVLEQWSQAAVISSGGLWSAVSLGGCDHFFFYLLLPAQDWIRIGHHPFITSSSSNSIIIAFVCCIDWEITDGFKEQVLYAWFCLFAFSLFFVLCVNLHYIYQPEPTFKSWTEKVRLTVQVNKRFEKLSFSCPKLETTEGKFLKSFIKEFSIVLTVYLNFNLLIFILWLLKLLYQISSTHSCWQATYNYN